MRWIQFTHAAVLGIIILPFIVLRDLWTYKGFLSWGHIKEKGWKSGIRSFSGGSFQAVVSYYRGLRDFFYEYEIVKKTFRWMPLRYVAHTGAFDPRCYCRVLYGGVCWWSNGGTGPGYIGGYAIVLTGCLDGWKYDRHSYRQPRYWWSMVVGRA